MRHAASWIRLAVCAAAVVVAGCSGGSASNASPTSPGSTAVTVDSFVGTWTNIDPLTKTIPRLTIRVDADRIYVHGFGACLPTNCDWEEASAPRADAASGTFTVNWDFGFKTTRLTLTLASSAGRLQTTTLDHYTDGSGRLDNTYIESFNRGS
jgi:hypothetical protein